MSDSNRINCAASEQLLVQTLPKRGWDEDVRLRDRGGSDRWRGDRLLCQRIRVRSVQRAGCQAATTTRYRALLHQVQKPQECGVFCLKKVGRQWFAGSVSSEVESPYLLRDDEGCDGCSQFAWRKEEVLLGVDSLHGRACQKGGGWLKNMLEPLNPER